MILRENIVKSIDFDALTFWRIGRDMAMFEGNMRGAEVISKVTSEKDVGEVV